MVFAGEIGPDKSAKIIPQMIFLFCGVFAQFLGTGKGLFLLFHIRTIPLIRPSVRTGAPSPQGEALEVAVLPSRVLLRPPLVGALFCP